MNRRLGLRSPIDAMAVVADERRGERRLQLPVRCWMRDGEHTIFTAVHDVSCGGLSIRAPAPFLPGTELELTLLLPDDTLGPRGEVAVRARGRVVWVRDARGREPGPTGGRVDVATGTARLGAAFLDRAHGAAILRRLVADDR